MNNSQVWDDCLKQLETVFPADEISNWLLPLHTIYTDQTLKLLAPNRYVLNHVKQNLFQHIETTIPPGGDKEHRRITDKRTCSISPQKLYGIPVAKMFFEGAPRLIETNVTVPGLQDGDPDRIVVEAYPGVLARYLVGKTSYKHDTRAKQTTALQEARLKYNAAY